MKQIIVYPQPEGPVAIIIPVTTELSIIELARKDVPTGQPFRILPHSDAPADREGRIAWQVDFTTPDGFGN